MAKNIYLILLYPIMAAVIVQYFAGNFPFHFFEFPLNIILGAIWIYSVYILLRKNNCTNNITRVLVSPETTAFSLFLFVCGTLVIGLFPQLSAIEAEQKEGILGQLGFYNFISSWIFVSILFILLSHLAAITIRGFKSRKKKRWREGKHFYLDYDLQLTGFDADYYQNGMPKSYVAEVKVSDRHSGNSSQISLEVNHPYEYKFGEDIYLVSYDTRSDKPQYCVLQIVRQPWKYIQLIGIIMTIAGAVGMFIGGPQKQTSKQ